MFANLTCFIAGTVLPMAVTNQTTLDAKKSTGHIELQGINSFMAWSNVPMISAKLIVNKVFI